MHIKVKVFPGSKKELVIREGNDAFTMYVREPALGGMANKRVTTLLRDAYPAARIRLVSGHVKQNKVFEIIT